MAGVVWIPWYATVLQQEAFAERVAEIAPLVLRYGATKYSVHRSRDDRYKITQMAWFESQADWYRYWDGPEMIEFRARHSGKFQIPVVYVWHDELVAGELGPEVLLSEPAEPEPSEPGLSPAPETPTAV
jgi:hypothetical protein